MGFFDLLRPSHYRARQRAALDAADDANSHAFNNDDLAVVSQMLHARHVTIDRADLAGAGRPDQPLTLSDVPMLLKLIAEQTGAEKLTRALPNDRHGSPDHLEPSMSRGRPVLRPRGRSSEALEAVHNVKI